MGAAQKSTHRVRRLPPADLGDGRDDPARQQAAAHRLVLPAYLRPIQRHDLVQLQKQSVRLLPLRSLAHKPSMVDPCTRPAFHSDQRRSSHRRARTQPRRQDAQRRRHIPGRLRLARSPPTAPPTSDGFVETAADPDAIAKTDGWSGSLRSPPIATMSMSSGPPLTSSCRHQPLLHQRMGARPRAASQASYLDEFRAVKTRPFPTPGNAEPLTYRLIEPVSSVRIEPRPGARRLAPFRRRSRPSPRRKMGLDVFGTGSRRHGTKACSISNYLILNRVAGVVNP